ncbi:MAG: ABC transporter ATP-binding protein, partial [Propionibacteriaceae bacterium]|nr:ABC transporter ATP-binding protein [Propionibacteriaceae bacterium]
LDSKNSTLLLNYLRQATDTQGQTIIMVTHDPRAAEYADRALILSDGRIVDDIDAPTADIVSTRMRTLGGE